MAAQYSILNILLLAVICIADVVVKTNNQESQGEVCGLSKFKQQFDVNVVKFGDLNKDNKKGKCMELKFMDQGTKNKFQVYYKMFTVDDCTKTLQQSSYERMPLTKFVDLISFCLSDENSKHTVTVNVNEGKSLDININYTPDEFTEFKFMLNVPAVEMNEIDLLKLRLQELESNVPILFHETLTASRKRTKGWNTINLDYCSDANNKYIRHDVKKGTITLSPGRYIIEAEGTAHYVKRHVIQIFNDDGTVKITGTPQASDRGVGWSTSTSRILKSVIDVKKKTTLTFRWWFEYERGDGALADKPFPYNDFEYLYVAAVAIQKV